MTTKLRRKRMKGTSFYWA